MNIKDDALKRYLEIGYVDGEFGNRKTFKRYEYEAKKRFPEWIEYMQTIQNLKEKFSRDEIQKIAKGERIVPTKSIKTKIEGNKFRFAHITDTHFGASCFYPEVWEAAVKEINKSNVDTIFHTGDITEGLSSRRMDAVFDLTHRSYREQKKYAVELLDQLEKPIYAIDGNHDRFFFKSTGALIVEDISKELDNLTFLGSDSADFIIKNKERDISIRLWHGEDSSSYATSYRVQKLVESFNSGDKPNVLLVGHTHKQFYMFERNIHCVSGGAICGQSSWMKSKRLANHTGFWIIDMEFNERGITKFSPTWHPFYL